MVRGGVSGTEEIEMEAEEAELSATSVVAIFSGEEGDRVHTALH